MKIKSVLLIRVKSPNSHAGCATLLSYEIQQRHLSITKTQDIALACAGGLLRILLAKMSLMALISLLSLCFCRSRFRRALCRRLLQGFLVFNQDIFAWARYMPCGRSQRLGHGRHAKRHRVRGKSPQRHGRCCFCQCYTHLRLYSPQTGLFRHELAFRFCQHEPTFICKPSQIRGKCRRPS